MSKIGGMQRVGIDLLEQLQARSDVAVTTVILRSEKENELAGFVPFLWRAWRTARSMMKRGEIDAVLFSAMPSAVLTVPLAGTAARTRVALATISHGHDVIAESTIYQLLVRRVLDRLDAMLPVSHSTGQECIARGLRPERLFVTPNGIDPNRFGTSFPGLKTTRPERRKLLAKAFPELAKAVEPNGLMLVSVGRQVKRKGHEWFIRNVMPKLETGVHLVLGGKGPESATISKAVQETGLGARVHQLGMVAEDQLATLYCGGDLFIMPNIKVAGDMEGFGVVMLEAGICGMPAIAARLEGIQDVITDGVSGFNVDAMDGDAFADIINSFARSPDKLDELAISARKHTIATFAWPQIATRITNTLGKVIQRKRA